MKRYKVEYTAGAEADIINIRNYIARELKNEFAAIEIARGIVSVCDALAIFPKGSPVWDRKHGEELRLAHYKNYAIIYYIHDNDLTVTIHAVIYSRRDIRRLLAEQRRLS